jgi:hypothetical protein
MIGMSEGTTGQSVSGEDTMLSTNKEMFTRNPFLTDDTVLK